MGRTRTIAGWLPAVVLVPAALVTLVEVSAPSDSDEQAMAAVLPLDPGTTWVYAVSDHGEPSGQRVRQVLGPSQLFQDGALRTGVRISSVYDDYPGRGAQSVDAYVGVEGRDLMQYGVRLGGAYTEISPVAPAYRLPAESGTAWDFEGTLGSVALKSSTEVTSVGDVRVGGDTFHGCTEWTTQQVVAEAETAEVITEWTCPGIGVVRSRDVYEADGVDISEELVEFHGVDDTWLASSSPAEEVRPLEDATSAGIDQARSNALGSGRPSNTLAWTDSRDATMVFAPVSNGSLVVTGEDDGTVAARTASGEMLWQVALTPPIVASPALGADTVYVADGAKHLWALSTADGSARWVHRLDDVVSAAPTVMDASVAVPVEDGTVVSLAAADGDELWSAPFDGVVRTPPALADGQLLVGDESGTLTALASDSGDASWSAALEDGLAEGPAVSGDRVVAVDASGVISAFDLEDGAVEWQAVAHESADVPLAVGSDSVVTVGFTGRVEAFDLDDGNRAWSTQVDDSGAVGPVIVGDHVVVVSISGRVDVLDLAHGTRADRWSLPRPSDGTRLAVDAPLGVVDRSLVVTASTTDPNVSSTSYAYRLDSTTPPGVAFTSTATGTYPGLVATEPVLDGPDVYALDTDGFLFRDPGNGSGPQPILDGVVPAIGFAAARGVVVAQKGAEVWGVRGEDGKKLWSVPAVDAYVGSVPAIGGDTAFVPLHEVGLMAVDLRSGDVRWAAPTVAATGSTTPLPLPGGDVAYAANGLARYDGRTGAEVWRVGGQLDGAVAFSRMALDDGVIGATLVSADRTAANGERTTVAAVAANSGEVLWQRDLAGLAVGVPPAAGDGVAVAIDGANLASVLDLRTGEPRWTAQLHSVPAGPPSVHQGIVTLVERGRSEDLGQRDFRVVARDAATGAFLGAYEPPSANDVTLDTVGAGPDGERLVPTTGKDGQVVVTLGAGRD